MLVNYTLKQRFGLQSRFALVSLAAVICTPITLADPVSGFSIDRTDRFSVLDGYHQGFVPSENFASNHAWNGNVASCNAGTTSADFKDDVLRRINYLRAMAGLSSNIIFDTTKNDKAQQAALIMSSQRALSHTPIASFPGNSCLTSDGDQAAGASNLSLGNFGPAAVMSQLIDDGSNNAYVGHRRWILYSRAQEMGTGDIPANGGNLAANCLWVIGDFTSAPNPAPEIAWPPEGMVPFDIVPNDSQTFPRWSFGYPGADFTNCSVTMSQGSTSIPVTLETVTNAGFGDRTLVWRPTGIPSSAPDQDETYTVNITGIQGAPFTSKTYDVTLIDPYDLGTEISVLGDTAPAINTSSSYSFNTISAVDSYQVRISEAQAGNWLEGAENSPTPQVVDNTAASYSLLSSSLSATGSQSFHLATPSFDNEDSFVIDRDLVPQAGSQVQFKYLRRFMTSSTFLVVELSSDEGASYTPIHSIPGASTGNSSEWDSSFINDAVNIPAEYYGKGIKVRFRMETNGSIFIGSGSNIGLHIDDIEVTNHSEIISSSTQTLASGESSFTFTPTTIGTDYILSVGVDLGGRFWGFGPSLEVSAATPSLTARDLTVYEGAEDAHVAVLLNQVQNFDVSFSYVSMDGSATAGNDYTTVAGTGLIPAGKTSTIVRIPITSDAVTEASESFLLAISNPTTGISVNNTSATVTIMDGVGDSTSSVFTTYANANGITEDASLGIDSDGDGFNDFQEHALGASDPGDSSSQPQVLDTFETFSGSEYFAICYLRLTGGVEFGESYVNGEALYEANGSIDLTTWDQTPIHLAAPINLPIPPSGFEWGCARLPFGSSSSQGFLVLKLQYIE